MLCITHKKIAGFAYEALESGLSVKVDYESLMNGSVAPDINPSMVVIPHLKKRSIGFLQRQIEWLTCKALPEDLKEMKEFSYRLGIVIHFISDYFCAAHNNIKFINPIIHYFYERRLKAYFDKHGINLNFTKLNFDIELSMSIRDFIEQKHTEYLTQRKSMENDFGFTLDAVINITLEIVAKSLKVYNEEVRSNLNLCSKTA
jgi:hypothetical protein